MKSQFDTMAQIIAALISVIVFIALAAVALSLQGCSSKEQYKQVLTPVPQKCDFNITYEPQISTADLQSILKSVTDLSFDSKELRRLIKSTPCLDVNYIEEAN